MGEYDFTYEIPSDFDNRVYQLLNQHNRNLAAAFQGANYEYEDLGIAYYVGMRGNNWNKHAVEFTIEANASSISLLKNCKKVLMNYIGKALKPNTSGFLVKDILFIENEDAVPTSNAERFNADMQAANSVLKDLIAIGERLCSNASYNQNSSENSINDYFRDMLLMGGYTETKDQTRHGVSANRKDAGEVDILLSKGGREIAIFEGLKLNSVNTSYIDEHINKSVNNYNALGTATFIVAYVSTSDFQSFWDKYFYHIKTVSYNIEEKNTLAELTYPNAATRIARTILSRDSYDFPVFYIALNLSQI